MKAITLWQPWASAIALGHKTIETRSWATRYRGPLAIHAARRPMDVEELLLANAHLPNLDLPLGAVVATCHLVECLPADAAAIARLRFEGFAPREDLWGNFSPGRYAWILRDVRALPRPIPARGAQGLWEWARR
jgi:hypothetical protein